MRTRGRKKRTKPKGNSFGKWGREKIQTLAMNSWMRVYAGRGPPATSESNISWTMSTFSMRESVLKASEDVAVVSKRAAFLLRGKDRREVPLWEGVAIVCGRDAEGVIEGAGDGAMEGVLDGLWRRLGLWRGVFALDRVGSWEVAWMAAFFARPFPLGALGGGGGSSTSGSSMGTLISSGALLTMLEKRGFSSGGTKPKEQSKYHPPACKWASENLATWRGV
jgi:hypothetical protein